MSNIAISDPEKFVTGYAEFKKNGEWYDFSRFFDSQYPAYDREAMFATCSREKAGIRLHMVTDAKAISFDVRKGKTKTTPGQFFRMMKIFSSKDKVHKFQTDENSNRLGLGKEHGECFDFLAGGVLTDSSDRDQGTIRFETGYAGGEPLTLEIVFPFRKQVEISNVKLEEASVCMPLGYDGCILFLGDSITQGENCFHSSGVWTRLVAVRAGSTWINQGVCGYLFRKESLEGIGALRGRVTEIVCALGTNDWQFSDGKDRETSLTGMKEYYAELVRIFPDIPIKAVTPFRRMDEKVERTFYTMDEWRALIAEEVLRYPNVTLVDGQQLMPWDSSYYHDGKIHPNDAGEEYIASHFPM